ncbi:response regulator transcription factor [Sphingosinicella sp. CPCC 101087]|uniref:LuxR C-terminal-related transcriptional regulator n=1 Tax=Sphingosinicella sp. CPCC 101087 TaxID=2497754 RepID=UPI00101B857E
MLAHNLRRVLIGDVHPLARTGLASFLQQEFSLGDHADSSSYAETLSLLEKAEGIDLVVLDMGLPGLGGAEGLRQLRLAYPMLMLIVFTTRCERGEVLEALAAGAHGCIPKNLGMEDLRGAFGTILSGHIYVPKIITDASQMRHAARCDQLDLSLTRRQREVLEQLAAGKSNKEIARVLNIAESTVKVHVAAAFRSLGVHNRVSAVAALDARRSDTSKVEPFLPGVVGDRRRESSQRPANSPAPLYAVH